MTDFDLFKKKYQKIEVKEFKNTCAPNPLVSICIFTYQQRTRISQCIEGVLKQKVSFIYEIILGEDESEDGTREICKFYAKKYPNKIRLFLHHRENNIRINGHPTGRFNVFYGYYTARGKYIAICEGDDYWTDPLKLQKQVDFLKTNPDYTLSSTRYLKKNAATGEIKGDDLDSVFENGEIGKTFNFPLLTKVWITKTLTVMFRRDCLDFGDLFKYKLLRDFHVYYSLLAKGKGYCHNFVSGVYTIHDDGIWSSKTRFEQRKTSVLTYRELFFKNNREPLLQDVYKNSIEGFIGFAIRAIHKPFLNLDFLQILWFYLLDFKRFGRFFILIKQGYRTKKR